MIIGREMSVQIGEELTRGIVHSGHFWQLGSIASLATDPTGSEIIVAFWLKHGLRSDLRVQNFS